MKREILHCDLNCFYASVEMLLNPELRDKAVAVCGNVDDRHGIVLTKSEKAKKCGVTTGEAVWQAKQKCPELVVVPPNYHEYMKYSALARKIYEDYTDMVEPFGIDECWLDVTGSIRLFGSAEKIANDIRNRMKDEIGLTISVGVSFNKIFAKLGSDMKKPDAVTVIKEESFREKIWSMPASDMLGVGRATSKKLSVYGIRTLGELANSSPDFLQFKLGVNGILLWRYANGYDDSKVAMAGFKPQIKSVGHGITCTRDLHTAEEVWRVFFELSVEISDKLHDSRLMAGAVQIGIRDSNLSITQHQCKLDISTQSFKEIALKAYELFLNSGRSDTPIRSLTVRAIDLVSEDFPSQLSLDFDLSKAIRQEKIESCMRSIRDRYGNNAIKAACLFSDIGLPGNYSKTPKMPSGLQR